MMHYKCEECENFTGLVCGVYWDSENMDLYEALKDTDCKLFDNNNILYQIGSNVEYNGTAETFEMHTVKSNREELLDVINMLNNKIKETYEKYDDFKIINTFVNPIIHQDGYYIELKKIEDRFKEQNEKIKEELSKLDYQNECFINPIDSIKP